MHWWNDDTPFKKEEQFVYGSFQEPQEPSISADHFEADLTYDELELNNDNKKFTANSVVINGTKSYRNDFMMVNINSDFASMLFFMDPMAQFLIVFICSSNDLTIYFAPVW